jgi:hypothetical protein
MKSNTILKEIFDWSEHFIFDDLMNQLRAEILNEKLIVEEKNPDQFEMLFNCSNVSFPKLYRHSNFIVGILFLNQLLSHQDFFRDSNLQNKSLRFIRILLFSNDYYLALHGLKLLETFIDAVTFPHMSADVDHDLFKFNFLVKIKRLFTHFFTSMFCCRRLVNGNVLFLLLLSLLYF